jgi:hypothetical protein
MIITSGLSKSHKNKKSHYHILPVLLECPWNVTQKQLREVLGKQRQMLPRSSKDYNQMVSILLSLP